MPPNTAAERIKRHLFENRDIELSTTQVMEESGVSRQHTLFALDQLAKAGTIQRRNTAGRTWWKWKNQTQRNLFDNWMRTAKNRTNTREQPNA